MLGQSIVEQTFVQREKKYAPIVTDLRIRQKQAGGPACIHLYLLIKRRFYVFLQRLYS